MSLDEAGHVAYDSVASSYAPPDDTKSPGAQDAQAEEAHHQEPSSNGMASAFLTDLDDILSSTTSVAASQASSGGGSPELGPASASASGTDIEFLQVQGHAEDDLDSTGLYPASLYPKPSSPHCVEHPYSPDSNGLDTGTINSSRTIYAEDIDYVLENGRWYCGEWYLPIDEDERIRQYVIHNVYLQFFHGELTTVPLDDPSYILDVGTGIGEWAIGMAELYPDCEVFGSDIAPIQETRVPSNVEFQIETAEDEWIRPANAVDLVHVRNMAGAFRDWNFVYGQAYKCIRPGGWIEIIDFDDYEAFQNFLSYYPTNSPLHILCKGLQEAAERLARPLGTAHLDPQLLIDIGFVDIKESTHTLLLGEHERTSYGTLWLTACVSGIEPTCLRPLTRQLGWDPDYVRELCRAVELETKKLANDRVRAAGFGVKLRVLVGRKPLEPGQWTAQTLNENAEIASVSDDVEGGDDSTIGSRSVLTATTGSNV